WRRGAASNPDVALRVAQVHGVAQQPFLLALRRREVEHVVAVEVPFVETAVVHRAVRLRIADLAELRVPLRADPEVPDRARGIRRSEGETRDDVAREAGV